MSLLRHNSFWTPRVMTCSALERKNIAAVWDMIVEYENKARQHGHFLMRRREQNAQWMKKLLHDLLDLRLQQNEAARTLTEKLEQQVVDGLCTPYAAAKQIVEKL